jgi:hypothetical protein
LDKKQSTDLSVFFGNGSCADNSMIGTCDRKRFILAATTSPFMPGI